MFNQWEPVPLPKHTLYIVHTVYLSGLSALLCLVLDLPFKQSSLVCHKSENKPSYFRYFKEEECLAESR